MENKALECQYLHLYLFLAAKDKEKNKEKKFKEFVRVKPKKKKKKKKKTKPGNVSLGFPYHALAGHGVAFFPGLASQPALRRGRASSPLMELVGSARAWALAGEEPTHPGVTRPLAFRKALPWAALAGVPCHRAVHVKAS